jgi:glycosyltransferase involved in cell wall biosynthesis
MRVLTVIYRLDRGGGIEAFLLNVFRAIDQSDLELEICCTSGRDGTLVPELRRLGIDIWCCQQGRNPFSFQRRFAAELRSRGAYCVVHAHVGEYGGLALSVAARHGVPVRLAHFHNTQTGHKGDLARRMYDHWMQAKVHRAATGIIGCSWAVLRACFPGSWDRDERMRVVRLGVPVAEFEGDDTAAEVRRDFAIPEDGVIVGHVGRFSPQKNHARLVAAARRVVDRRDNVYFLLVGDGALREQIAEQVRELDLTEHLKFAGLRADVPRLMRAMDVFTLPSLWEGFGLVLIEAQLAGAVVAASDIPPAREAVAPAFHRFLRDPHDVEGLAESILELLDERERDPTLVDRARAYGAQFTVENSVLGMQAAWGVPGVTPPEDPAGWAGPHSSR